MPVWLLLQPRDYLASYFLYFAVIIGTIGMVLGSSKFTVELPAFKGFVAGNNYLWPMLFIIVACGALSGFHSTTRPAMRTTTSGRSTVPMTRIVLRQRPIVADPAVWC